MRDKISEGFSQKKYEKSIPINSSTAYVNKQYGWNDYLISEQLIFSHRISNYTPKNIYEDLHAHDFYELVICAGGDKMQYITDGQCLSVKPGTVILTKPLSFHMFRPSEPVLHDRYIVYFKPSLNIFCEKNILNFLKMGNSSYCAFHFSDSNHISSHAYKAEQELLNPKSEYATSKAILHICNLFVALSENVTDNVEIFNHSIPQYLIDVKENIDKEFTNIDSTTDIANKIHYSREYITRNFHQYFNTTLYEYILKRKLVYCCSLLRQGISVEKAAALSGFRNMSGFNRIFRKYNGCTPSEYKARKHF